MTCIDATRAKCVIHMLWETLNFRKMLHVLSQLYKWYGKSCQKLDQPLSSTKIPLLDSKAKAMKCLIQHHQQEYFPEEINTVCNDKKVRKLSKIAKLLPWYDGEYVRVGGRLQQSSLHFDTKHPIILHPEGKVTQGLIMQVHVDNQHAGTDWTLNRTRELYWILKGRRSVRSILNACLVCKRFKLHPLSQQMAPLPQERTTPAMPFELCATDLTGPILIKLHKNTTETIKAYIVLFTCLTSRAIHLEVAPSLSADDFLQAFKRFINRRGPVKVMYSDNGTNLKRTSKDLINIYRTLNDKGYALAPLTWKFSNVLSPWEGGVWERLMRSIKEPLRKIMGRASLTYPEFYTLLTDVENMINQRPLTPRSESVDSEEPITPAHLLIGRPLKSIPVVFSDIPEIPESAPADDILQKWKHREMITKHFWDRWVKGYLVTLNERAKWLHPQDFNEDQIVLLQEDNKNKGLWPIAKIIKVTKGRDGLVRSVQVRTPKGKVLTRPVQKICKLECEKESLTSLTDDSIQHGSLKSPEEEADDATI